MLLATNPLRASLSEYYQSIFKENISHEILYLTIDHLSHFFSESLVLIHVYSICEIFYNDFNFLSLKGHAHDFAQTYFSDFNV